jgi:hypothetical protein
VDKGDEALLASCRSSKNVVVDGTTGAAASDDDEGSAADEQSTMLDLRGDEDGVNPGDTESLYRLIRILIST